MRKPLCAGAPAPATMTYRSRAVRKSSPTTTCGSVNPPTIPTGYHLEEQRLDVTQVGEGTIITRRSSYSDTPLEESAANAVAENLGLGAQADGLTAWDVFDDVLQPGNPILLLSCIDPSAAELAPAVSADTRRRTMRVVRDYGMFDRRENPQYYPEVTRH
jgi:hypothetical protein